MNVTTLKTIGLEDFVEYNLLKEVVIFYKITNVPLFFLLEKATKYKEWNCSYSSDILFKGLDCINKNNEKISPFIAREYESIYDYYRQTKSEVAYERLINNF